MGKWLLEDSMSSGRPIWEGTIGLSGLNTNKGTKSLKRRTWYWKGDVVEILEKLQSESERWV